MRIGILALSLSLSGAVFAQAPTDPQIAHIAATAHSIDIARGKDALKKSKNAEVKQFAEQMVEDHGAGLKEAQALLKKLGVKPEDNPTSQALKCDPKGTFVRRWIPELANVPDTSIHEPWKEPQLAAKYPKRIVVHEEQRVKALAMFKQVKH